MTIIITTENNSYIQKSRNVNFYPNLSAKGVRHVAKSLALCVLDSLTHPLHMLYILQCVCVRVHIRSTQNVKLTRVPVFSRMPFNENDIQQFGTCAINLLKLLTITIIFKSGHYYTTPISLLIFSFCVRILCAYTMYINVFSFSFSFSCVFFFIIVR